MPHDSSGHIYRSGAYGVEIADIEAVLEVTGDLATLCSSSAINMWNLNKPVPLYDVRDLDNENNWQSGRSGDYGIVTNNLGIGSTGLSALTSSLDGGLNGWSYTHPRGISTYREWSLNLFFDGYYHQAPTPWSGWIGPSDDVVVGSPLTFALDDVINDWSGAPDSIYYGNILLGSASLSSCYFGVVIYTKTGNNYVYKTCGVCANPMGGSTHVGDTNWKCVFNTTGWTTDTTYYAFPFFWVSDGSSSSTPDTAGYIYTIPYTSEITFSVVTDAVVSFSGACALNPDYSGDPSKVEIEFSPLLSILRSGNWTITRFVLSVSPTVGTVYDTTTDEPGFSAVVTRSGSPYYLITQGQEYQGITDCPASIIADKLSSGNYTATVTVTIQNSSPTPVSTTYSETYTVQGY